MFWGEALSNWYIGDPAELPKNSDGPGLGT